MVQDIWNSSSGVRGDQSWNLLLVDFQEGFGFPNLRTVGGRCDDGEQPVVIVLRVCVGFEQFSRASRAVQGIETVRRVLERDLVRLECVRWPLELDEEIRKHLAGWHHQRLATVCVLPVGGATEGGDRLLGSAL